MKQIRRLAILIALATAAAFCADFAADERVILSLAVGYRVAKIEEFEECGETAELPDGSRAALDYSGFVLRAAIKVILS